MLWNEDLTAFQIGNDEDRRIPGGCTVACAKHAGDYRTISHEAFVELEEQRLRYEDHLM